MSIQPLSVSERSLRYALARDAYRKRRIRIIDRDVRGCDLLIATKKGLYAGNREGVRPLMWGLFFGITRHADQVYLFENGDNPAARSQMGRILRFRIEQDALTGETVFAEGLSNGCHQLEVIDQLLCVVDTPAQAIVRLRLDGTPLDIKHPVPMSPACGGDGVDRHLNSIAAVGERIALVLHNGDANEASELVWVGRDWRVIERQRLAGYHCHDILALPDGAVWHCGSRDGEVISSRGDRIKLTDRMTRGLVAAPHGFVVGTSLFGSRAVRDGLAGSIIYLDPAFNKLAEIQCPGAPTDLLLL